MEILQNKISKFVRDVLAKNGKQKSSLIPILQDIQKEFNYLPDEVLKNVCKNSEITPTEIIGVASFYKHFRLKPAGENRIKVCVGTACHVKGAEIVYDAFHRELGLRENSDTDEKGKYTLEKVSCLGCCTLAPVVQINETTYGHVKPENVQEVLADFENQKNKTSKKSSSSLGDNFQDAEIRIGLGSCCVASGSFDVKKELENELSKKKINVRIKNVGCVGMCHQVPLVEVEKANSEPILYAKVQPENIKEIVSREFKPISIFQKLKEKTTDFIQNIQYQDFQFDISKHELNVREKHVSAFLNNQLPVATEFRGAINPVDFDEYVERGGFQALKKALKMKPSEIISEIKNSGLRGRGGAGFLTGTKWELVANQDNPEKYVICNGDEGDPGAFMDRMLLESYPFRIIEGILIAAFAVGARNAIFYIRNEYPLAVQRVQTAIDICKEKNIIGKNIDVKISRAAGAFVCGEETALISSIEGNRGFPKIRPPYPSEKGLWEKPTLVNNTETFAQIAYILNNGSAKFSEIGTDKSKGTKVFSLAGKVKRGGLIEVPMGMTINEIVNEIGGGIAEDKKFKAVQIGGPSGGCIPHWLGDTKIDFQSLQHAGAMMGSGGLVVLDESDCMVDIAKYFLSFTQDESCGKCTFCRIGTKRMLQILEKITTGKAEYSDLDELEDLGKNIIKGSLCGLGKTAPNPVLTSLKYFREEYEAHIKGKCPSGKCKELITYKIDESCIACTICAQNCPVDAIAFTPKEIHTINSEKCIRCDVCRQLCPEKSVFVE